MGIIDELFEGGLHPADIQVNNPKYIFATARQEQFLSELSDRLSAENNKTLEKLMEYCSDMEYEHGKNMFLLGFSMGVRFTAEGFAIKEKTFRNEYVRAADNRPYNMFQ